MSKTVTTLEERVQRIEKHLSKKHWLDEDSGYTLDRNAPLPWPIRLFGWIIVASIVGFFGLLIYANVTS